MSQHPGCHGSIVAISHLSDTCKACACSLSCLAEVGTQLDEMGSAPLATAERKRVALISEAFVRGIKAVAPAKVELTQAEVDELAQMPKQVSSMVKRKLETGWFTFARLELSSGRNPGSKPWERVLCRMLLAGAVTQKSLSLAFMTELAMTPGSAKVRASKALAVFRHGGLTHEVGSLVTLSQGVRPTRPKIQP